jgi:hypothetical protein
VVAVDDHDAAFDGGGHDQGQDDQVGDVEGHLQKPEWSKYSNSSIHEGLQSSHRFLFRL